MLASASYVTVNFDTVPEYVAVVPVGRALVAVESDNDAVEPCTVEPVTRLMEYDCQ